MTLRTTLLTTIAAAGLVLAAGCSAGTGTDGDAPGSPAVQDAGNVQPVAAVQTGSSSAPAAAEPGNGSPADQRRTITAVGTGKATGTPDTVTIRLGVQIQASTASKALDENSKEAKKLIAALKKSGIATEDLQTSRLSINPQYSNRGRTVTGYQASNMVTATVHDVTKAGSVIDSAQQAVGDAIRVNGVSFSFSDDSSLRASARTEAVKHALAQAKQLAKAAGVTVGQVLSISEATGGSSPMHMFAAASAAAPAPLLPGSADLSVTVQVTVAIA